MKSPRYLADAMRQLLMSEAQYATYQARVRELTGTLQGTEVRSCDGGWIVYNGHPDGIDDGPFPTQAEAYAYSRRMATKFKRSMPVAEARMIAEREVTAK